MNSYPPVPVSSQVGRATNRSASLDMEEGQNQRGQDLAYRRVHLGLYL